MEEKPNFYSFFQPSMLNNMQIRPSRHIIGAKIYQLVTLAKTFWNSRQKARRRWFFPLRSSLGNINTTEAQAGYKGGKLHPPKRTKTSDFGQNWIRYWLQMPLVLVKTTGGLKFSGLGLDRTKHGPDSVPGQILDQFLKSFDGKKSEKTCISVQHRYVLVT